MTGLLADLRFGARMLARSPGFTAVALATLALGVGLNSAIFSVVNSVLLRSLPYRDADRIVRIWETHAASGIRESNLAVPNFLDLQQQGGVFEEMAMCEGAGMNLTGTGEPERLQAARVSAGLFPLLGAWPVAGRAFGPEENRKGAPRSVVLSHGLWQRRFGGEASVVGRSVVLDGRAYTVSGIMPPGFDFPDPRTELWLAIEPDPHSRGNHGTRAIGKLKAGIALDRAEAELNAVMERLERMHPENAGWRTRLVPLRDQVTGRVRSTLLVLMGAVSFVLLIACANVANLLLARAPSRRREIAIRAALGAGRLRILRQLLAESLLLAAAGGLLGVALGKVFLDFLAARLPETMPRAAEIGMDLRALAFTFALALLTGLLFGVAPALAASRSGLVSELKDGGVGAGSGRGRRLGGMLAACEVALAVMLLIGAGLLARSFLRMLQTDLGFRPEHVLTMRIELPEAGYCSPERQAAFFDQALENIRRLPHVSAAGAADLLHLRGSNYWGFAIEGGAPPKPGEHLLTSLRTTSAGYFEAMGLRLLRGRTLTAEDGPGAPPAAVINDAMARRYWPGEDALGKRFKLGGRDSQRPWLTVVGIAAGVRHGGFNEPPGPEAFISQRQFPERSMFLAVRAKGDPAALTADVRRAVAAVDPNQPVSRIETMASIVRTAVAPTRVYVWLLSVFGVLALALALLGIYGVVAYAVTQRTREIGIRMALGARPRRVLALVLRQALGMVAAGLALGLAGAAALTRLLAGALYQVRPTDPATFIAVGVVVLAVGTAAAWLPARRAAGLHPSTALRHE